MLLVVDRNAIRRGQLASAASDPGTEFVLIDTFFVEMLKHPERWASTFARDLAELEPFADRLRLAMSVGEAFRLEFGERRAITRGELLPPEFQPLLGEFMQAADRGGGVPRVLVEKIRHVLPALRMEQPDLGSPKIRVDHLVETLRRMLAPETLDRMRRGDLDADARMSLAEALALKAYEADCAARNAWMLPTPGSMVSRFFILKV